MGDLKMEEKDKDNNTPRLDDIKPFVARLDALLANDKAEAAWDAVAGIREYVKRRGVITKGQLHSLVSFERMVTKREEKEARKEARIKAQDEKMQAKVARIMAVNEAKDRKAAAQEEERLKKVREA